MRITLGLLLLAVTSLSFAQDLAIGTKSVPAMYVAFVAKTSSLEAVKTDTTAGLTALWTACRAAGLHPIGVPTLSVALSGIETGPLSWEAWLVLTDLLDPARLPQKPGLTTKQVPATQVVYTYHAGDPWQMEPAFERLHAWATNQNLPLGGRARTMFYVWPGEKSDENTMTECQFELRAQ
jgi:hypothetical protein